MATLNILYEDPHILVCVKPHGIATQSKSFRYPDMVSLIKNHLAKASGTSGKSGAPKSIGSRTPGSAELTLPSSTDSTSPLPESLSLPRLRLLQKI